MLINLPLSVYRIGRNDVPPGLLSSVIPWSVMNIDQSMFLMLSYPWTLAKIPSVEDVFVVESEPLQRE